VSHSTHLALDAWNIPEIKKRTCQKSQHNVGNPIINPVFGDGWNPTHQNGEFLDGLLHCNSGPPDPNSYPQLKLEESPAKVGTLQATNDCSMFIIPS